MSEYRVGSLAHANAEKSYTPKVGDKVRAKLGENVLVGEVTMIHNDHQWLDLAVDGFEDGVTLYDDAPWEFEQLVSVPSKFGAVIRRADGVRFILTHPDPAERVWMRANDEDWYVDNEALAGGFSVLFDGVDE